MQGVYSEFDLSRAKIAEAAWRIEDAIHKPLDSFSYPHVVGARDAYFEAARADIRYSSALICMLLLSIFETPAWCGQQEVSLFAPAGDRCSRSAEGDDILLSGVPYVPLGWGLVIEIVLLYLMFLKFRIELRVQTKYFDTMVPKQEYYKRNHIYIGFACIAFAVLDIVYFAIARPRFRLAFIARTGLLVLLPSVVNLSRLVYSCLSEFFSVAAFFVGAILLFAWVSVMVLRDLQVGAAGFTTFSAGLNNIFVAGVSEEFLSVFLESYTTHRWVGWLWLLFLIVAHVLLLSLVLDTLTAAYMTYSEQVEERTAELRISGLLKAFRILANTQEAEGETAVSKDAFLEFIREYAASPKGMPVSEEIAKMMFDVIDTDGSGLIDYIEFCGICRIIQYRFWCTRADSRVKDWFPQVWNSDAGIRFRRFVKVSSVQNALVDEPGSPSSVASDDGERASGFDRLMNIILLVNFALVMVESYFDLNNIPEPPLLEYLELIFSFIYFGEVSIKLSVISWEDYWAISSNKFDFFSTFLLLTTSIIELMFAGNLSTYANMLRLLRLLRVIKNVKNIQSVQFLVKTIANLLLTAKEMVILLGVVVFFFSMLSVQVFGGELYEGNKKLEETEYHEQKWHVLNFNDTPMAFGVWVVFLLMEYAPIFPDAVAKASSNSWGWIIFPIFYLCGVSITFELVKAFTIEVFINLFKKRTESHIEAGSAHSQHGSPRKKADSLTAFKQALAREGKCLHYNSTGRESQHEAVDEALERVMHRAQVAAQGSPFQRQLSTIQRILENEDDGHGHSGHHHSSR